MPPRRDWTRDELLVAFNLYFKTPFGRLHRRNPEIIALAGAIGRTPSALAMKLVNFASFDPVHQQRNVSGLKKAGAAAKEVFEEFASDWGKLAYESELARERLIGAVGELSVEEAARREPRPPEDEELAIPEGATEAERTVKVRRVQRFFSGAVLASYNFTCAMCGLKVPPLLNASHIIPWSVDEKRRADPTNGISLCALHDRAFDRGLLSLDEEFAVMVSKQLKGKKPVEMQRVGLIEIEGQSMVLPRRFRPDPGAVAWHRERVFVDHA